MRGMTWYQIGGDDGLCYEDTTALARGFDHDLWIGTARGAIRNTGGEYQFFGHERWIPHDYVNAIACAKSAAYVATGGGLGIISYEPYTLAKKAAYYERWLEEWGMKRLGFVHILFLEDGRWVREVSDNDVGYSTCINNGLHQIKHHVMIGVFINAKFICIRAPGTFHKLDFMINEFLDFRF